LCRVPFAKIFRFTRRANHLYKFAPSHPTRGAYRDRHGRGVRMRWTRQRFACDGIAGRIERSVSDHRHADERCCCGRQNRVVLTPRRWRQVLRSCVGPTGLRQNISADDGGKRARSPGRARHKLLKPLRAGMPGDSGVLVVARVRSTNTKCTRDRGCNGHPAFPTPSRGRKIYAQLGRSARRDREVASDRYKRATLSRHTPANFAEYDDPCEGAMRRSIQTPSFRGARQREPQMCNCTSGNLEIPGSMRSLSSGRALRGPVGIAPE
jgi:hypothetical protein